MIIHSVFLDDWCEQAFDFDKTYHNLSQFIQKREISVRDGRKWWNLKNFFKYLAIRMLTIIHPGVREIQRDFRILHQLVRVESNWDSRKLVWFEMRFLLVRDQIMPIKRKYSWGLLSMACEGKLPHKMLMKNLTCNLIIVSIGISLELKHSPEAANFSILIAGRKNFKSGQQPSWA